MFSNSSPLPYLSKKEFLFNMSMINLDTLSNDNLKKLICSLTSLDYIYDECAACGHPTLLPKEGPCTRTERVPPDTVIKI